eukprot:m.44109 g.44109  ORF g.44109 m.44109 type:complete len:250 (+) comp10867_c0_seq1:1007-1756(+)
MQQVVCTCVACLQGCSTRPQSGPLFSLDDWDDFDKVGINNYGAAARLATPTLLEVWDKHDASTSTSLFYVHVGFDGALVQEAGAPRDVWVRVRVPWLGPLTLNLTVELFNKTSTRLPEALFYQFVRDTPEACAWTLTKLGQPLDPDQVVNGGGRHMHVVDQFSSNCPTGRNRNKSQNSSTIVTVTTPDSGLVTLGPRTALPTPTDRAPGSSDGVAVVLLDNLWGTNYIMWYPFDPSDANIKYEFSLSLQ